MTLEKAIEILKDLLTEEPQFSPDDRRCAVKLGIEALKRRKALRSRLSVGFESPLSGET